MGWAVLLRVVVVLLLSFAASGASAGTMTFDALPAAMQGPYEEDGITATADFDLGRLGADARAHLDDGGTPFARSIVFTMAARFTPVSFEVFALDYDYCPPESPDPPCDTPYANVRVALFRDGGEVYGDLFSAGAPGTLSSYAFPELEPVDFLTIRAVLPDFDRHGGFCADAPCGHFDIDDVTLVPEPPLAPQAVLAAAAVGLRLWRRARSVRA